MAETPSRQARAFGVWRPLTVYAVVALVFSWPLVVSLRTHLGAPEGLGDPYLNLWILGWDLRTLTTHPAWLLNGRIFDANIFYPAASTLAYSDHQILQALFVLPVYILSGDPVLCYNVLLFGSLVASGLAMHALARSMGAAPIGAYVAGIAWACWPYRVAHLVHLQLQALYFLPLALLFLLRVVAGGRRRDAVGLGLTAGLQAVSSIYCGVMTAVTLAVMFVGMAGGVERQRWRKLLGAVALAAITGALVVAPVVWPYWRLQQDEGFARSLFDARRQEANLASYLQVPEQNLIYGRTHLLTAHDASGATRPWRRDDLENDLFPGVVLLLLAAAGVFSARHEAGSRLRWTALALASLGLVLSMGTGAGPLFAFLHRFVFGFQAVRAPARFGVLVAFGLAILAARGATTIAKRHGQQWAAVLLAVLCVEYASMPLTLTARPSLETPVGQWLAAASGEGAVLYLPLTNDNRLNTVQMVDSLQHLRPIVNGYSGQRPSFFRGLVDTFSVFPTADALWALHDLDVRFVVAPVPLATDVSPEEARRGLLAARDVPLIERARFPDGVIYELAWSPDVEARLTPPALPAPPPPGPLTFHVGEKLTYDVRWVSGPVGLSAGQVSLGVEAGPSDDRPLRFFATAETAPWIAQFFEAHDRFETTTGLDLLPRVQRRALHEGRRELTRDATFDAAAGVVHVGPPDGATMPFRFSPGTRDPLAAFFYVRTLPLGAGDSVVLPINDSGRNYIVNVRVVGPERISLGGRMVDAVRLEPAVVARVSRHAPIEVVVWLSPDPAHRVLAADIGARFGRVRLELTGTDR
jgi:Protein of unknown function (DUF3108)